MIVSVVLWLGSRLRPLRSERGASLVEYALLIALIALVCIVAVAYLGGATSTGLTNDGSSMFVNP